MSFFKSNFLILQPNKVYFLWCKQILATSLLVAFSHLANATTFTMPQSTESLIDNSPDGRPVYIKATEEESLIDIAVQYLLGQEEIVSANKNVDRWLPRANTNILIPSRYVLPNAPRQGIVINLPEYRLYYYATDKNQIISYSVGIGRVDWKTPLGLTKIVGKVKDPTWTPPPSIRAEHLAKGDVLPEVWAAGPDNPLGLFSFRLGIPGYLLHSTNKPQGVGMQVSHGCMRLYPKDIAQFFPIIPVGTQVNIINQPVKVGWSNGNLYIESHPNLEGEESSYGQRLENARNLIQTATLTQPTSINEEALKLALTENNGLPTVISSGDSVLSMPPALDIFDSNFTGSSPALIEPIVPDLSEPAPPVLIQPVRPVLKKHPPMLKKTPYLEIPSSDIAEELSREQKQERKFKNSPFPRY